MIAALSPLQWDKYKKIIDNAYKSFGKDILVWRRYEKQIPREGEDRPRVDTAEMRLNCLFQYNNYRTWPITQFNQTGSEDKQSEVAYLNIDYLKSLDLLDEYGNFTYNQTKDIFIHKGVEYEASGDTPAAQASDKPLYFMIILKRKNAKVSP